MGGPSITLVKTPSISTRPLECSAGGRTPALSKRLNPEIPPFPTGVTPGDTDTLVGTWIPQGGPWAAVCFGGRA